MTVIRYRSENSAVPEVTLVETRDFQFRGTASSCFTTPSRDLLSIAAGVYSIDRLLRRCGDGQELGRTRSVSLTTTVSDPAFWRNSCLGELIAETLAFLSGDDWNIEFEQGQSPYRQGQLFAPKRSTVCLYSGGLDSLAGLASQMKQGVRDILAVTLGHIPRHRPLIEFQLNCLSREFGADIESRFVPMALIKPPPLSEQELSQRCRSFLFCALATGVCSEVDASRVEVYESGVGAVNIPFMTGMEIAGRSTRSSHPRFLELMSKISSIVLGRSIQFALPFDNCTKGEVVRNLKGTSLEKLLRRSFSCIHTSPRSGRGWRQCGTCPACVGRRQALRAASIDDPVSNYELDVFDPLDASRLSTDQARMLKAILAQSVWLADGSAPGRLSEHACRHLKWSQAISADRPVEFWSGPLLRYALEWEPIVERARAEGVPWATWFEPKASKVG